MEITVNGDLQQVPDADINLLSLLENNGITDPQMVAVQLNGRFVESGRHSATPLSEGDVVEFLYFMGGGS